VSVGDDQSPDAKEALSGRPLFAEQCLIWSPKFWWQSTYSIIRFRQTSGP
jgi:hypothetical protein